VIARAVDAVLEASVIGSFSRIGYHARRRLDGWPELDSYDLAGRTAIVTGGTSGLGRETARTLLGLGARVCVVGRDRARTERACAELHRATGGEVEAAVADLSVLADVRALATELAARHERVDVLVHSAGALLDQRTLTPEGNEVTVATHVLAPFLLTSLLGPQLAAAAPGRVVLVSSGGMYAERLDVAGLGMPDGYDGVRAYARAKRAQVALAGEWARRLANRPVAVTAMHPGWADTPGIRASLPRFSRALRPILRTPGEGADTIVWLAVAPDAPVLAGRFVLDRRPRAVHKVPWTRRADEDLEAARLWRWCVERTGAPAV
jgi:dehydrogenase/reductase SDR family member 12